MAPRIWGTPPPKSTLLHLIYYKSHEGTSQSLDKSWTPGLILGVARAHGSIALTEAAAVNAPTRQGHRLCCRHRSRVGCHQAAGPQAAQRGAISHGPSPGLPATMTPKTLRRLVAAPGDGLGQPWDVGAGLSPTRVPASHSSHFRYV